MTGYCEGPEWLKELATKTEEEIREDWKDYAPQENTAYTSTLPELGLITNTYACGVWFSDEDRAQSHMDAIKRFFHAIKGQIMADLPEPRWVRIWPEIGCMPAEDREIWKVRCRCRLYVPADYRGVWPVLEGEVIPYIKSDWGLEEA